MQPRPRGRPPGEGPPARFVRSGSFAEESAWVVSERDDPGEVAAAFAQQQLVQAIRTRAGKVSAADVARTLGREAGDPTVSKVLAGRRAISMHLWFALALAFDVDPLGYSDPADRRSLLPPAHRIWLGPWRPGQGLPRFRVPTGRDGEPAWVNAAQHLAAWLEREDDTGRLRLADTVVARHAALEALAEAGLPVNLVGDLSHPGARLTYETEPVLDVVVHLIPDDATLTRSRLLRIVSELRPSAARSVAVILAASRALERMDALVPGYANAAKGYSVRIPSSTTHSITDVSLTTLARTFATNGYVTTISDITK